MTVVSSRELISDVGQVVVCSYFVNLIRNPWSGLRVRSVSNPIHGGRSGKMTASSAGFIIKTLEEDDPAPASLITGWWDLTLFRNADREF